MMRRIFFSVFVLSVLACGCSGTSKLLKNNYLLYSMDSKAYDRPFAAGFFYVNINDTIFHIEGHSFNYMTHKETDTFALPETDIPYCVKKMHDGIYHQYFYSDTVVTIKVYPLKQRDTVKVWSADNSTLQRSMVFTGQDTVLTFLGHKFVCSKYIQYLYGRRYGTHILVEYMDKRSWLPTMLTFMYPNEKNQYDAQSYVLRTLISVNDVKTKEWRYPPEYYKY